MCRRAGPLQRAQLAAIGGLIDIDKEVTKGKAANAVVVAHQGPLREVHYTRLRELNALADALEGGTGQGSLPPELKQLARQGPGSEANTVSSATPTQPPAGVPMSSTALSGSSEAIPTFGEISQPYIDMRRQADPDDKDIGSLELRRETWRRALASRETDIYGGSGPR